MGQPPNTASASALSSGRASLVSCTRLWFCVRLRARAGRARQAHTGEPPSDEQVGALLGLTRERVMLYRRHVVPAKSLEQPAYAGASHKDRTPVMWDDKVAADDPDVGAEAAHFAADVQVRCPDYCFCEGTIGFRALDGW